MRHAVPDREIKVAQAAFTLVNMAQINSCPYVVVQRMRYLRPLTRGTAIRHMELGFTFTVTVFLDDGSSKEITLDYVQLRPDGGIQIWVRTPIVGSEDYQTPKVALALEPTRTERFYELLAEVNSFLGRSQWVPDGV